MIIMLNGSFGVGKTTTAKRLAAELPNAMIYDPEIIGFFIKRIGMLVPLGKNTGDYQDLAIWRKLTVITAWLLRRWSRRTLIVPMTLAWPVYFREITSGLRRVDPDLHHFCLTAPLPTIEQRLLARGEQPGAWVFQQMQRCATTLATPEYALHIDTERNDVAEVVRIIRARIGQ